ncbi:MAG: hypothetical protein U0768_19630 [Anaerolineae bacterium]
MPYSPVQSYDKFENARRQASVQDLVGLVTRQSNTLVPFDAVRARLRSATEVKRGTTTIPLNAIVGSVGRYLDFTRKFLPRDEALEERWRRLDEAMNSLQDIPPIDVYKLGDVYFVRDGNHRVSVARANGMTEIEANVTEIPLQVPLTPDMNVDQIIIAAEKADFLDRTRLNALFPDADITFTAPGRYAEILEHIDAHRWYMGIAEDREVAYEAAVQSWYENVYLPAVAAIRDSALLKDFPKRTEADLYLWTMHHLADLKDEYGEAVDAEIAAADLARQHTDRPVGKVVRAVKSATHKAQNLFTGDTDTPPIVEDLVNKLEQEERRRGEIPSDSG